MVEGGVGVVRGEDARRRGGEVEGDPTKHRPGDAVM